MIPTLAWRNLWRRSRRTVFSAAAIALTCVVVVFLPSLQAGSYAGMVRTYTGLVGGYAQIQDPEYLETPAMRDSFQIGDGIRTALSNLPDGVNFSERGIAYALLSSDSRSIGTQIMGVDAQSEPLISTIPSKVVDGDYFTSADQIVLGETLARNLQVGVGDSVTLLGVGRDGSLAADVLPVAGVFRSGIAEIDRSLAQMPLSRFDTTFAMDGERHAIVINGSDTQTLDRAIEQLRPAVESQGLALRDWTELEPSLYSAIQLDITGAILMYVVLIIVVVVSLLNTLLMSVLERTHEFGMMMALGVKARLLRGIVWSEIGFLSLLGVGAGMIAGAALTVWLNERGIVFESAQAIFEQYGMSATLYPELTPLTLLAGPAVIVLALLAAGIYPALRIRRLNIINAMRFAQ